MIYVIKKKAKIRNRNNHVQNLTQDNTRPQWTDKTAWQTQNINNTKSPQKQHRILTSVKNCSNQRIDKLLSPRARPLPFLLGLNYWVWYGLCIRLQWQENSMVGMKPQKFSMPQYNCRHNNTVGNGNIENIVVLCTISQTRLARWMQRLDLLFARKQNAHDAIHQHKLR